MWLGARCIDEAQRVLQGLRRGLTWHGNQLRPSLQLMRRFIVV